MADLAALFSDVRAEQDALVARVEPLDEVAWRTSTPAAGWDVADSCSHLLFFDEVGALALRDAEAFATTTAGLLSGGQAADLRPGRTLEKPAFLERWAAARADVRAALAATDPKARIPWFGPPMGVASFATARLMEVWAHGQDVADALGLPPVVSDRLRHVCHIGVGARPYAFLVNNVEDPGAPVRVEATSPDGSEVWAWGPEDAADRVTGAALDVALVLTRRRHPDDVDLTVEGPTAEAWIRIAQSFAGPPGPVRAPGESSSAASAPPGPS